MLHDGMCANTPPILSLDIVFRCEKQEVVEVNNPVGEIQYGEEFIVRFTFARLVFTELLCFCAALHIQEENQKQRKKKCN